MEQFIRKMQRRRISCTGFNPVGACVGMGLFCLIVWRGCPLVVVVFIGVGAYPVAAPFACLERDSSSL